MAKDDHDPQDYFLLPASEQGIKDRITMITAQIEAIDADLLDPTRLNQSAATYMQWRAKALHARSISFQEIAFLKKHLLLSQEKSKSNRQRKQEAYLERVRHNQQAREERIQQWEERYGSIFLVEIMVRLHRLVEELKPEGMEWTDEQLELLGIVSTIRMTSGVLSTMKTEVNPDD